MPATVHISSAWLIAASLSALFVIVYPLVLALIAHQRLKVSWRYFGFGALIFLLFQVVSRVPIVTVLGNLLAPQLKASPLFLYIWLAFLALTAGLAEEIGRYIGYRWLMKREEKTWSKAVMYGLGHGGLESMLLIGGLIILNIVNVIVLSSLNLNTLPAAQHAQVVQQVHTLNAQPIWMVFLGSWERLWAVPFHVALSVIVLQVFVRNNITWLWLAVVLHALLDGVAVFLQQILGAGTNASLIIEGIIAVAGIASIWIIWRLRNSSETRTDTVVSDAALS